MRSARPGSALLSDPRDSGARSAGAFRSGEDTSHLHTRTITGLGRARGWGTMRKECAAIPSRRVEHEVEVVVSTPLRLMAVHAHPDDEASSTGGLLALSASQGVETVVVTCTDGALGDDLGGAKPDDPAHDRERVVMLRKAELDASCAILGVSVLATLGFADSGMMGWPENSAEGSFWSMDVAEAAAPLIALMEHHRPDVVVTYDANGFYGHPDHIQAHRITLFATEATGIPAKVYFPTFPRSVTPAFVEALREAGEEVPEPPRADGDGPSTEWGTPDDEVSAWIDCSSVVRKKRAALEAHATPDSQHVLHENHLGTVRSDVRSRGVRPSPRSDWHSDSGVRSLRRPAITAVIAPLHW
jgi:LmbE family N-acetylglucosaminyl deacetylase